MVITIITPNKQPVKTQNEIKIKISNKERISENNRSLRIGKNLRDRLLK